MKDNDKPLVEREKISKTLSIQKNLIYNPIDMRLFKESYIKLVEEISPDHGTKTLLAEFWILLLFLGDTLT